MPLRTPAAACRRRGRGRCQAPLTRPAPARHSRILRHRGGSGLAPSRSRPSASGECAGRRAKWWEPSAAEAVPPPAPSLVGGRCVWELEPWRTRFAANFGGRLRVGVGERGRWWWRQQGVSTASSSGPQLHRGVRKWEVCPSARPGAHLAQFGGRGKAASGRHFPRSWGSGSRTNWVDGVACDPSIVRVHQGGARSGTAKERCWGHSCLPQLLHPSL